MSRRLRVLRLRDWARPVPPARREVISATPEVDEGKPPVLFVPGFGHGAWAFVEHWLEHTAARGYAAHAMSPVGGIGINLAIQDAVATANLLAAPLARGANVDRLLPYLQQRRLWPTKVIQSAQRTVHENVLHPLLSGAGGLPDEPPLPMRLLDRFPLLRRIPGWFIGHGVRQEHVRSPMAHF